MIEVTELTKQYGKKRAVDALSFSVDKGEIVGFLGPNGAGKSTTMRILAGYLAPSKGKVTVDGHDVLTDPLRAKAKIGYMPEAVPLYPEMRVAEYLSFRAEAKGVARAQRITRVGECMEKTRIEDVANTVIGALSKGYKQRVGLADALLAKPPLLLLDEPTAGLDPNQIREVRKLLGELGRDHTVLVSTHILSEVEAFCSRALVVHRGRLVAEGTLEAIRARHAPHVLTARVRAELEALRALLTPLGGLELADDTEPGVHTVALRLKPGSDLDERAEHLASLLAGAGMGLRSLGRGRTGLEEVFVELTRSERATEMADALAAERDAAADGKAKDA